MESLRQAIRKEMYAATKEATEKSYEDLKGNVSHFYDSPEGRYHRTNQLKDSPQLDGIDYNGDSAIGQISINTGTQYNPAGRDTETIYGYGEDGGLLGNGGFWQRTKRKIKSDRNLAVCFGK